MCKSYKVYFLIRTEKRKITEEKNNETQRYFFKKVNKLKEIQESK